MFGEADADIVREVGDGADTIDGGTGGDRIISRAGDDVIELGDALAGEGPNLVFSGQGKDDVNGGDGSDILRLGRGRRRRRPPARARTTSAAATAAT